MTTVTERHIVPSSGGRVYFCSKTEPPVLPHGVYWHNIDTGALKKRVAEDETGAPVPPHWEPVNEEAAHHPV